MYLAKEAYERLGGRTDYLFTIQYSGRFSAYNASVRKQDKRILFMLSKKWQGISDEIVIGLLQNLLIRILRMKKQTTLNIDLYDVFIKSLQKTTVNPVVEKQLQLSFERVNQQFFSGLLELPHMKWGQASKTRLANYNHHTDTITVSSALKKAREELLDFVMYHEMLHKKLQYGSSGGKVHHHTAAFKRLEQQFPNATQLEKELRWL